MPTQVCAGAMLRCSFGAAPAALSVPPALRTMAGGPPAATILDHAPFANIPPFGTCSSNANPTVAAASAAAGGTLTPMPCVPATTSPWAPGAMTVVIGAAPALHDGCKLACLWGGVIEVAAPGQLTVTVD
jgi:hypothetical protein